MAGIPAAPTAGLRRTATAAASSFSPPSLNDVGLWVGELDMGPSPPAPQFTPYPMFNLYPGLQVDIPWEQESLNPSSVAPYEPAMGIELHMESILPSNLIAVDLDPIIGTLGSHDLRDTTMFEINAGQYQSGHPSSNPVAPPSVQAMRSQSTGRLPSNPATVNERENRDRRHLRCRWEGCTFTRAFNRDADLVRHLKTIHISPRSYRCTVDGCFKSFNREDRLNDHKLRVHQM
ncbi:hypothetical protein BDV28DRAFT_145535 [Aspergillus coremiiformis]|uniref:C2H2-type domain-containing protein n=1 Tax=Aspergillus coremiiformis TaxID=138285 RepID=A0A5N6ZFN0_9EURO|nr:hypothetical protein BDV28DRAFT_145535 [Aspergillus coremiiformis]